MDGAQLVTDVTDAKRTQLDRLGGDKSLLAVTDAHLETERVLETAAASECAAHETFEAWADTETDARAREDFASVATEEREHYVRVLAAFEDSPTDVQPADDPLHEYLHELDDTPERVGAGLVGRPLVAVRTTTQVTSFFINEADESRADLFRELKADTEEQLDDAPALLDEVCGGDEEYDRARTAAETAIQHAYDEYAAALDAMGFSPKSLC